MDPISMHLDSADKLRITTVLSSRSQLKNNQLVHTLKRLVKLSPLWPVLRPRQFHAYCVGPAKSGTVSVNGMFSSRYRSAHETTRHEIVELMIMRLNGQPTKQAALHQLRKRDRKLRLEMESSSLLAMFVEELATAFPRALFLLTMREPRTWLNSIINQHLNVDVSNRPSDNLLRQLLFMPPGTTYSRGEEELERMGLFPLDGYLSAWSSHYEWVINAVPSPRLLIIRTEDLSRSTEQLGEFLSIPTDSIDNERSHLHRCPHDHGIVNRLPRSLVEEKVESHCDTVLSRITAVIDSQTR